MSQFFVEFFVSQYQETLQGNPSMLCFRKILLTKKFMDKREGEVSRFPSKIFCLRMPKHFVEEPFCAVFQKISVSENVYG